MKKQFGSKASLEKLQPEMSLSRMGFSPKPLSVKESSAKFPPFLDCIEKMIRQSEHTDTKVVVGAETFNCHMIVLKGYSEYFKKLDNKASIDTQKVVLPDDQVTPLAFSKIYEWMLSDEDSVPRIGFAEIFKSAKFLGISELTSQLMCYIDDGKVIGEREALSIYLEAKEINEKSLQDLMRQKISKIFLTFVASWEYLELTLDEIRDFFKSNRLAVNSELDMLFAAIRWLQHEWSHRKNSTVELLKLVRFELIQSWQLVELKRYPKELEHIFKIPEVKEIIDNALSYISMQFADHLGKGDCEVTPPKVFNRLLIHDPHWNELQLEHNPNVFQNFCNFCKYLKEIDACRWRKVKYADPRHESAVI